MSTPDNTSIPDKWNGTRIREIRESLHDAEKKRNRLLGESRKTSAYFHMAGSTLNCIDLCKRALAANPKNKIHWLELLHEVSRMAENTISDIHKDHANPTNLEKLRLAVKDLDSSKSGVVITGA